MRGAECLGAAGISSPRLDARVLLALATATASKAVFADEKLDAETCERFSAYLARRAAREPLAYITGTKEFWSLDFAVGQGVLIPRPESETLVEAALRETAPEGASRVLDIGTGSGCLLIAFLSERLNARGVGIDLSDAALVWARRNVSAHGMSARCRLERADREPSGTDHFDIVLVNPPYLTAAEFEQTAPEIRHWEPRTALLAGEDGLEDIRAMAPLLRRRLAKRGRAFMEIGRGQAPAAREILACEGLDVQAAIPDLSGVPRCLVVGQAGSGSL